MTKRTRGNGNGNGNGYIMRLVIAAILALVQLIVSGVLLWVGSATLKNTDSVARMEVKLDERSTQTASAIKELREEIKSTAAVVADVTKATAASLATNTANTAQALATSTAINAELAERLRLRNK